MDYYAAMKTYAYEDYIVIMKGCLCHDGKVKTVSDTILYDHKYVK